MKAALAALLLCATAAGAAAQEMRPSITQGEAEWLAGVHLALGQRDCKLAVSRLNDGLEQRYPEAYVMAGAMFEQGLCVKAQWDRATTMYQRALAAGHRGGHCRLVAGLAERDPPVALWWSQEGDAVRLPAECRVPAEAHRNAEAYAAALGAWPTGRMAACTYVAGVLSAISGELEYPGEALGKLIEGGVRMQFQPAEGRIEWHTVDVSRYSPASQTRGLGVAANARDILLRHADEVGRRALARFKPPTGIDPAWQMNVDYTFTIR